MSVDCTCIITYAARTVKRNLFWQAVIFVEKSQNYFCSLSAPNFFFLFCIISHFPHKLFSFPRGTILIKVRIFTMEMKKNDHIHCSVTQCKHNMGTENYCCLNSIPIGTHEPNPTVPECTDCFSFVKRNCCE